MTYAKIITSVVILLSVGCFGFSKNLQIDVKPHPDDVRLKRDAMESDVVTPVKMGEDLNQIATSSHFRSRRSVNDDSSISSDNEFQNPVYKITAFGEDLFLRLQLDEHLIAPSYTTSFSWKNRTVTDTDLSNQAHLRKCFYKGVVVGKPSSQVAVSICDSMTGSIYTDDHVYFISPLGNDETDPQNQKAANLHSIQRRSISSGKQRRSVSSHGSSCGVNDARHRRRYEQTFKINPIEEAAKRVTRQVNRRSKRSIAEDVQQTPNVNDFELESNDDNPKARTKRSFDSRQHYIETMIVADASMLRHHGDDLEHYILSIMMVANRVFSHPSLGSAISLSVVKIMIVEDEREGPRISTNAAHTLREFCSWQKQFNVPDDSDPEHFDLAILLTKVDMCGDTCDTLGMAEVGAMCSSRRSCAIVEDDGLSSSYTVAHEICPGILIALGSYRNINIHRGGEVILTISLNKSIGHVLNMMHDDNRLCRANFAAVDSSSHVMSSTMERVDSEQPWSLCSKQAVIDFLEDGRGECLLDKPQKAKVYPRELPGAMYDINHQCEMSFGRGAIECPYMRECSRLWCQLPRGSRPNQCHTKNFPRADGSACAPGSHCMQGKCVTKVPEEAPIDGSWGSWSQYGSCSRSCGGGVQMSSRQCNSPAPRHGGKYCIGSSRLRFRSCQTQSCPSSRYGRQIDFRAEQCASYNGQRFPGLGVRVASTWIPKYVDIPSRDRCKLICQSVQTGTYVTLSDRVIDGTRCSPDTTDVCVHGQCMPAGCDGRLFSKAKYNKCGLCNTGNKHCQRITGKYNKRQSGYSDVVTLPKGAGSIKIQQRGFKNKIHDGNYLALVNSKGRYLLNGGLTLSTLKKDIAVNGTVLQYSGVQVVSEKIHSTMPLKEPITLQVLSLGLSGNNILPPKIKYSYFLPKPQTSSSRSKITGSYTDDSNVVTRRRLKPNPPTEEDSREQPSTKSSTKGARWVTGRWAKCKPYKNRKCGQGSKKRKVTCKIGKEKSNRCDAADKPKDRQSCSVASCPSATPIRRPGTSTSRRNDGPSIVNRLVLHNEKSFWNAGMWGSCSTSCGLGIKRRMVMCQTSSGRLMDKSSCNSRTRPPATHGCNLRKCY